MPIFVKLPVPKYNLLITQRHNDFLINKLTFIARCINRSQTIVKRRLLRWCQIEESGRTKGKN